MTRRARLYALLFWIYWSVIVLLARPDGPASDGFIIARGVGTFVVPILLYLWCKADSSARSVQPPSGATPLLAALFPVGWAYYLLATRPFLRAIGVIVGSLVFAAGLAVAGQFVSQSDVFG